MNGENFNEKLGLRLRELRKLNQFTQDELAKKTGLSRASIANMETGRQAMSAFQAYSIATALQLPDMNTLYDFSALTKSSSSDGIFRPPELEEVQFRQFAGLLSRSVK